MASLSSILPPQRPCSKLPQLFSLLSLCSTKPGVGGSTEAPPCLIQTPSACPLWLGFPLPISCMAPWTQGSPGLLHTGSAYKRHRISSHQNKDQHPLCCCERAQDKMLASNFNCQQESAFITVLQWSKCQDSRLSLETCMGSTALLHYESPPCQYKLACKI
eukprot:3572267-Amphidinium_carterae.1